MARRKRSSKRSTKPDYQARKIAGVCTYPGCPRPAAEDSGLCPEHLEKQRERLRRSSTEIRKARRRRGLCAACGKVKSKKYRCSSCSPVPASRAENGVYKPVVLYIDPEYRIEGRDEPDFLTLWKHLGAALRLLEAARAVHPGGFVADEETLPLLHRAGAEITRFLWFAGDAEKRASLLVDARRRRLRPRR